MPLRYFKDLWAKPLDVSLPWVPTKMSQVHFAASPHANRPRLLAARPARLKCRAFSSGRSATATAVVSSRNGSSSNPPLPVLDDHYESNMAFASYANWLLPGHLMVGRYPFVEPSRCASRELGEEQLKQILEAGITTFVSLQAELPPQEQMKLAGKNGFLPYKATADLIRSSLNGPPPMEIVEGLRNPSLDKFLPPKKRRSGNPYNPISVQFVHCPVEDLGIPSADSLNSLLADLESRLSNGEKLYVHCWGGRGRAGTVGAALLASMYNLTAEEALERIQRAFDTRKDNGRRSPETDEQIEFVRAMVAQQRQ